MLVHHWAHATTPAGPGWDTVISSRVRLETETGFSARAALGEADIIRVVVDDPAAEYDFATLHRWYMVETDCPSGDQLVWNGYIGDQSVVRGSDGLLVPTGSGRIWTLDLVQENTILGLRVVTGPDGNRPAETAQARLTWLLASDYLSTVKDHGLIDWAGLAGFAMDAVDYRDQTAADVLRDISLISGYNHYARYNETYQEIELACYDPNTSTLDPSSLQISNVAADIDLATTWPAAEDTVLARQGSRVAAGISVSYAGGRVYKYDYSTSYEFGFRDTVASVGNVKTLAAANALASRLLGQHASQDERVTTRIRLPSSRLNDVKHGQWLPSVRLVHAPGSWSTGRPARVVSRSFGRPGNLAQSVYDVELELSPMPARPQGAFGASFAPGAQVDPTLPHATTPGRLLVLIAASNPTGAGGLDLLSPPSFTAGTGGSSDPWQTGAPFTTAYDQDQYGGPGAAVGVGIWWRRVGPNEATTTPVKVWPIAGCFASAWLYEVDVAGTPGPGATYTSEPGYLPSRGTATLPVLSGPVVLGAFVIQQASYEYASVVTPVTGTTVFNGFGDNLPFTTDNITGWAPPRTWIGMKSPALDGAALAVRVAYEHDLGNPDHRYGVAGAAIVLPEAVSIPTIPYPANQVG